LIVLGEGESYEMDRGSGAALRENMVTG
jgi:hypothetical protein